MAISVEVALQLQVFDRTTVHVFAGQDQLTRQVRWVHPVEIPDIAQFLTGGEMLLTAGLGIGRSAADQRRYIREISNAGAAALVIELSGRAFKSMPPALIAEAQQLDFPLIGLDREVPFVEVSAQVHELLAGEANSDLVAFEKVNAEFIRLLLAGRSQLSFTEALAYHTGFPVVLEDADHRVVAYAGGSSETDSLITNWGLHSRMGHQRTASDDDLDQSNQLESKAAPGCIRRRIVLQGEAWGWLHIFHGEAPVSNVASYAIERAADGIAITLISDRESGARASHRQHSLVNRLLLGDITGEQFVERALRVGRDLRDSQLAVVMLAKSPNSETGEADLEDLLEPLRLPTVVADIGECVMAVVGLSTQFTSERLCEHLNSHGARAGVSRGTTSAELLEATKQARAAISVATARDKPSTHHFDQLGVLRLLVALSRGKELEKYVADELGPLLDHDRREPNQLIPTLRAYLDSDGNKSRAADALFVQRRTLYYRLERLHAVLGRSIEEADTRASLSLALRAYDFLQGVDG